MKKPKVEGKKEMGASKERGIRTNCEPDAPKGLGSRSQSSFLNSPSAGKLKPHGSREVYLNDRIAELEGKLKDVPRCQLSWCKTYNKDTKKLEAEKKELQDNELELVSKVQQDIQEIRRILNELAKAKVKGFVSG